MNQKPKTVFAPGCALMLYKPALAQLIQSFLNEQSGEMETHLTCCKHQPHFKVPTTVINVCPGCDKRFAADYENSSTLTLWEMLAQSETFPFPDYQGQEMTIQDACPTREKSSVQDSIRILLQKMNITLVEPEHSGSKSKCCGDNFYPQLPIEQVNELMKQRTAEMPLENVIVYCVSCIQSISIGGKTPRYLPDLLFNEKTFPNNKTTDEWHRELDVYIEKN